MYFLLKQNIFFIVSFSGTRPVSDRIYMEDIEKQSSRLYYSTK